MRAVLKLAHLLRERRGACVVTAEGRELPNDGQEFSQKCLADLRSVADFKAALAAVHMLVE